MNIRLATPADSAGIARVQVDSYLNTYAQIFPKKYLAHFSYEEQEQDWQDWFAAHQHPLFVAVTAQDEVAGYALGQQNAKEIIPYQSELVALHVRATDQHQGLGRGLIGAVSQALAAQGFKSMFLWVLAENPACKFYEKLSNIL